MTKYQEFKKRKIESVDQLIEVLQKLPKDVKLLSEGGDIGGYDVSERDYLDLNYCKETNSVRFSHMEYELYKAQEKGLITYDEFLELNNESEYE